MHDRTQENIILPEMKLAESVTLSLTMKGHSFISSVQLLTETTKSLTVVPQSVKLTASFTPIKRNTTKKKNPESNSEAICGARSIEIQTKGQMQFEYCSILCQNIN